MWEWEGGGGWMVWWWKWNPNVACFTYLIINCIKFGQKNAVNDMRFLKIRMISERLIEPGQLINSLITNKSLTNKQHEVGFIHFDQLENKNHQIHSNNGQLGVKQYCLILIQQYFDALPLQGLSSVVHCLAFCPQCQSEPRQYGSHELY